MPEQSKRPIVTIFADASFAPQSRAGGWGTVVVTDAGREEIFGEFKEPCEDALEAEVKAATNALHAAAKRQLLVGAPVVVLQIDSQAAIAVLLCSDARHFYSRGPHPGDLAQVKRADHVPARCVAAVAAVRALCVKHGATLALRHVKGHMRHRSRRHALNDRADALARGALQPRLL